jgi:hypothetical protein
MKLILTVIGIGAIVIGIAYMEGMDFSNADAALTSVGKITTGASEIASGIADAAVQVHNENAGFAKAAASGVPCAELVARTQAAIDNGKRGVLMPDDEFNLLLMRLTACQQQAKADSAK